MYGLILYACLAGDCAARFNNTITGPTAAVIALVLVIIAVVLIFVGRGARTP